MSEEMKVPCPTCGTLVRLRGLRAHEGKGRCRVDATKRGMEERGWEALPLTRRTMLQRAGVPHERAPGTYQRDLFGGHGGYPHAMDRVWVPRWVKILLDVMNYDREATELALLKWAIQEPDLPGAILVAHAMGGDKAVREMVELSW